MGKTVIETSYGLPILNVTTDRSSFVAIRLRRGFFGKKIDLPNREILLHPDEAILLARALVDRATEIQER